MCLAVCLRGQALKAPFGMLLNRAGKAAILAS